MARIRSLRPPGMFSLGTEVSAPWNVQPWHRSLRPLECSALAQISAPWNVRPLVQKSPPPGTFGLGTEVSAPWNVRPW
ncbi:unnamed protein product [Staurois parvus]|uniref:Uncharacterized protein n=1 Tax=Staurois parvus TaxID=386267 RepID=A0ABN9ADI7_9NEOB|nr:unnamed protein product [Staurois parvus]